MNEIPLQYEPDPNPFRRPLPDLEAMLMNIDDRSEPSVGFLDTCDSMTSDFESLYDGIDTSTVAPARRASAYQWRMDDEPHPPA